MELTGGPSGSALPPALWPTLLPYLALVLAVAGLRLFELRVSRRRQRALAARGVPRVAEPHFRAMVALHTSVLVASALEAWLVPRWPIPLLSALALLVLLAASALRIWVIRTLGPHWNVQIMDSGALGVVTRGPYRWIRHPNYVAVFLELAALPLVHGAWVTALVGTAAHLWVLSHRIRAEEAVLLANPEYQRLMGGKPRFLPLPGRARRTGSWAA
jgi:methyltransferase